MPEPSPAFGTLYVVATPLGNLEDVTLRALRVLREVALVACEDTRRTRKLLQAHGIGTATTSYFEHNERSKGAQILAVLRGGKDVALVSDAGTPTVSDPGEALVCDARSMGIAVVPIPGPSAVTASLSVCGLPSERFLFIGFLPAKPGARRKALEALAREPPTLVFFESPVRVVAALEDMLALLGDREAFLCREATKSHEEYVRAPLSALRDRLAARAVVKGEIVLVVAGASGLAATSEPAAASEGPVALYRRLAAEGRTRREAVKEAARLLGRPAREVYDLVQNAETEETEETE